MKNPLARIPWFVAAPAFLGAVLIAAVVSNYLGGDYFKRTRLDEANPLAAAGSQQDALLVLRGEFQDADAAHRGSGTATVLQGPSGGAVLRLENFSVTNGPDLFVVLSPSPDEYVEGAINLGDLKATDGNFNYEIPAGTDLSKFQSVVIWCRQFDVTFAFASLAEASGNSSPDAAVAATATVASAGTSVAQPTAAPAGPVVLAQGSFRDGEPGHRGSGVAKLGRDAAGKPVLVFEGFSATNGPDLHVILGDTADGGGDGLDLGKLKATDGTFSYAIPDGTDLAQFRSVTIWCASFPTIFAVATLEA